MFSQFSGIMFFRENDMFDSFYSVVNATIDKHAPLKKLSKREAKGYSYTY